MTGRLILQLRPLTCSNSLEEFLRDRTDAM